MTTKQPIIFCSDHFVSRIYMQHDRNYIAHYLPTQPNAFKVSLLQSLDNAEKQHKNFVFFAKFQASYQPPSQKIHALAESLRHLIQAHTVIDPNTGQHWKNQQLKLRHFLPDVTQLPDCQFNYIDEQWYGLEKCHTTTYTYQIQSGQIRLLKQQSQSF